MGINVDLLTSFTSAGGFWRPELPAIKISGRFIFEPSDRLEIELSGTLPRLVSEPRFSLGTDHYELLHGQLSNGEFVTLWDCFVKDSQTGAGRGSHATLVVNKALRGVLAGANTTVFLKSWDLSFTSMEEWIGNSPLSSDRTEGEGGKFDITIRFHRPSDETYQVPSAAMSIALVHSWTARSDWTSSELSYTSSIQCLPELPIQLDKCEVVNGKLQDLISLFVGVGVKMRYLEMEIFTTAASEPENVTTCSLIALQFKGGKDQELSFHNMIIPYTLIRMNFGSILCNWFMRAEQSKLALAVYFGSLYQTDPNHNLQLLTITQALESYHRAGEGARYMPQAEYDSAIQYLKTMIPACIKGDHRKSLANRLDFGNQFSMRKRLTGLLRSMPAGLRQQIATIDVNRFVNLIVDTRNYFTHYDPGSTKETLEGMDIYYATRRLRALFVSTVLTDLGLDPEMLPDSLSRSPELRHALAQPLISLP